MSVALFTNNPQIQALCPCRERLAFTQAGPQVLQAVNLRVESRLGSVLVFLDADAFSVVEAARDCIHAGWLLLHHPLYGNYRPYQQPYRSILLQSPAAPANCTPGNEEIAQVDESSLHLIEEALLIYNNSAILAPGKAPASLRDACAMLDRELMRLPLEQAGLLRHGCDYAQSRKGPEI